MSAGRILFGICALILGGVVAFMVWAWRPPLAPIEPPAASIFDPALIAKGAELAAIGNCALCHTNPGGRPFAGGLPIATPFGAIYSTNITPDVESGIGAWSEAAFRRAMHEGVDRDGRHLYPAFPYDHFTKTSDSDLAAIYAFVMTREPVRAATPPSKLPFPLDIRLITAGWQLLFFKEGEFRAEAAKSEMWNRGAYLVEGLGHCGSCHTPRNLFGAEEVQHNLAGGEAEGWDAPALNSASPAPVPWTEDALFDYLRRGWDPAHGIAAGPMAPVVRDLARVSDQDVRAIAAYIASLAGGSEQQRQKAAEEARAFAKSRAWGVAAPGNPGKDGGEEIFAGACAGCHRVAGTTPVELALSTAVNQPDPRNLIRILIDGIMPEDQKGPMMPGFADVLTDQQVAALVSYVRARFTERPAWPNVAARVHQIRDEERR